MASEPRRYLACLLRLWPVTGKDGSPGWRASVEDVHTGARQGFGSLEQLFAFLLEQTVRPPAVLPHTETPPP
jgi:hypothetical protein